MILGAPQGDGHCLACRVQVGVNPGSFGQSIDLGRGRPAHDSLGGLPAQLQRHGSRPGQRVIKVIEVRIPVAGGLDVDSVRHGHIAHAHARLLQQVELDPSAQSCAAPGSLLVGRAAVQDLGDQARQAFGLPLGEPALGDPGGPQADSARIGGGRVAGDRVAIDDDTGQIENASRHVARQRRAIRGAHRTAVDIRQVGVGAAKGNAEPGTLQCAGERHAVGDDLVLQRAEGVAAGQLEGHRLGGDGVDVRAALFAREHRPIDLPAEVLAMGDDGRAPRAAQRLVGGEGDHIGDADRRGACPGDHQPGHMGDIGHQVRADRIGDLAEAQPVYRPGVGRVAGDQDLGFGFPRQRLDGFVIDLLRGRIDGIRHGVIQLARAAGRGAVRKVAAVQQVHSHQCVAGLQQSVEHGVVGRRTGERLQIDVQTVRRHPIGGEGLGAAPARQRLDRVGILDALVVARVGVTAIFPQTQRVVQHLRFGHAARGFVRIALGVDVLERRGQRLTNSEGRRALRRDQDQPPELALPLQIAELLHIGINLGQIAAKQEVGHEGTPSHGCAPWRPGLAGGRLSDKMILRLWLAAGQAAAARTCRSTRCGVHSLRTGENHLSGQAARGRASRRGAANGAPHGRNRTRTCDPFCVREVL